MSREMKDSSVEWIGNIPNSWKTVKAKRIFCQRSEKGNSISEQLLSPTQKYGVIPQALYEKLTSNRAVKLKADTNFNMLKTIHKNDYCISLRSFQGGFEYSTYEGVVSPAYQVFYAKREISYIYYKYMFKSIPFIDKMNSYTLSLRDGKNISFENFANSLIPLPPLSEQQKIADFLDEKVKEIDNAIENIKITIDLLEKLKAIYIIKIVTGKAHKYTKDTKEWFDKIPSHWNTPKIKYMANVSSGGTPSRDFPEYWGGNIGWIKTGELQNNEISNAEEYITNEGLKSSSAKIFKKDTILVAMYGQGKTRGMTALLKNEMSTNQACAGIEIKSDKLIPKYLQIALMAGYEALRSEAIGSGQPNLNGTLIENFKIPLPPVEEQKSIINQYNNITSSFSSLMKANKKLLYSLETYKKSLIYEYVTGKKEVK